MCRLQTPKQGFSLSKRARTKTMTEEEEEEEKKINIPETH
jgi:hypothetical protein